MKGIVFTEFFEMVDKMFGDEMSDKLIENTDLPSNGIYTAVGTYSHSEIVALLFKLNEYTGVEIGVLLNTFGKYLFDTFLKGYPGFFEVADNAFDFLESIQNYIHVEVLKLYPDAQLPKFSTEIKDESTLEMVYESDRKMADLAEGLMEKSLEYYKENAEIIKRPMVEDHSKVLFIIKRKG